MMKLKIVLFSACVTATLGLMACGHNDSTPPPVTAVTTTQLVNDLIAGSSSDTALPMSINDAQIVDTDTSDTASPTPLS
jgi:hypothetical protein